MTQDAQIQAILKRLPQEPGVYQHFDKDGRLLYVGKAKNLRRRVASYFNRKQHDQGKTKLLVAKIADIRWLVTESESDALLLENSLIKEYQPMYNIQLKDDKTYPFIVVKNERFPRIQSTRQRRKDKGTYFGPFPSIGTMHTLLELSQKLYPVRNCTLNLSEKNIESGKFRVCLEYHLGNCKGPCVGHQSLADYERSVEATKNILRGNLTQVSEMITAEMELAAAEFRYEDAAQLKVKHAKLRAHQTKHTVVQPDIHDVDVFSVVSDVRSAYVNFLKIYNGTIVQGRTVEVQKRLDEDDRTVLEAAIPLIRERFHSASQTIYTPFEINPVLPDLKYRVPQRGDKKRLIEMSERNARYFMKDKQKQLEQIDPKAATDQFLEQVKRDLLLTSLPRHIECFDNSNTQGTSPASACVVFREGKPCKADYRKFNIETVDGPDDFASMREVVFRRYSRLLEENVPLPQLIVIDGGKGQLSHALEALEELGLRGTIAIIGIAKRLEEIYFPGDQVPLFIDKRSRTLKLIQHLRNEAHRFSLDHHRKRRSKSALHSVLDDVPGVGPATREKLMHHFKSLVGVRAASPDALEEVVSRKVAEAIYLHFKSE